MSLETRRQHPAFSHDAGFSLIEVIVATVIATFAVVGLAYAFSMGRGFINRFEIARAALGVARGRIETLATDTGSLDLTVNVHGPVPFVLDGVQKGQERWIVEWVDDPVDGLQGAGDSNPHDLKRLTVEVNYTFGGIDDTVRVSRLLPSL